MAVAERADARRNRVRLVEATCELFASRGVDVSVREIAREAGVGVATLYRHFPTRDDLLDAVLEDAFAELAAAGARALATEDAWAAFTGLVEETLTLYTRNHGLKDIFETRRGRQRAASMRRTIRPLFAQLVERAQAQGALRTDFDPHDLPLLFWSISAVIGLTGEVAPNVWRRQLGLVLDGLRAPSATPLPHPALSGAQLQRIEKPSPDRRAQPLRQPEGEPASRRKEHDVRD